MLRFSFLMLEAAANANLVSTISQKRNTPFLQLSTSGPADYPIFHRQRASRPRHAGVTEQSSVNGVEISADRERILARDLRRVGVLLAVKNHT
jgi:hypothetical protein